MSQTRHKHPAIDGLAWHRTQYFSYLLPMDEHSFQWETLPDGRIHSPNPDDSATVFTIALTDPKLYSALIAWIFLCPGGILKALKSYLPVIMRLATRKSQASNFN